MGRNKPVAANDLQQWIERTGRTRVGAAEEFEVTEAMIGHLLTGARTPSLALALRIADIAGIAPSRWSRDVAAAS